MVNQGESNAKFRTNDTKRKDIRKKTHSRLIYSTNIFAIRNDYISRNDDLIRS